MANNPQRWQPPSFQDPNLDISMKTAYQSIYGLEAQSVQGASNGMAVASGQVTVLGVQKGVVTGLASISNVVVSIRAGAQPRNYWVNAIEGPNGTFDVFVTQPTGVGDTSPAQATVSCLVSWIAFGTAVQPQQ